MKTSEREEDGLAFYMRLVDDLEGRARDGIYRETHLSVARGYRQLLDAVVGGRFRSGSRKSDAA